MIRMSTSQMFNLGINSTLQSHARLSQVNNQMATGKKVLTPADDPVAAAQTLNTKTRMSVVQQYNRNIDFADKNLSLTESVLNQTESSLIRLKEQAIQLGSDQWSDDQVRASGIEVREILSHLQGLVNTRNESNEYIFAGSQADQKAYDGNRFIGDRIEREAQVADDTFIKMLTSGARAFENLEGLRSNRGEPGAVPTDPPLELYGFRSEAQQALDDGLITGPLEAGVHYEYEDNMLGAIQYFVDATGNGTPPGDVDKEAIRHAISNIDIAFEKVAQTRAQIGARQNTLEAVKDSNQEFELFAQKTISDLEDLDYAEAFVRLETSMMSYQAGMQVMGRVSGLSLFNYI
ncbi:flagellar hook-associated protein FlgL [Marinospirillum alkaliphilum]|uniref:Flagellar hook-associated protein 3 n=1 Tax=Marinospirillum alkaliphilum DSM 21637 TaxID=1122209 RepID=A0A1K1UZT8_9GAMM|nr:flagellar hook-associated protein FlgL [Marinospirillum alkaliphilum]SFX18370.1 flagellar hook-associated protein 3 [Marinospirillum alkaliphilum DSM 21637]